MIIRILNYQGDIIQVPTKALKEWQGNPMIRPGCEQVGRTLSMSIKDAFLPSLPSL